MFKSTVIHIIFIWTDFLENGNMLHDYFVEPNSSDQFIVWDNVQDLELRIFTHARMGEFGAFQSPPFGVCKSSQTSKSCLFFWVCSVVSTNSCRFPIQIYMHAWKFSVWIMDDSSLKQNCDNLLSRFKCKAHISHEPPTTDTYNLVIFPSFLITCPTHQFL